MGLFLDLLVALLGSPKRSSTRERDFDAYGLTEDEKKIARREGYDPWDFDEEEMDEDSYYNEDN